MSKRTVTAADVAAFKRWATTKYGALFFSKSSVPGIAFVALAVEMLGGPSAGDFSEKYATTVGNVILMPDGLTPAEQIAVIAHELAHVVQFWKHPDRLVWLYLTAGEARAAYEAEAYRVGAEVDHALTGRPTPVENVKAALAAGYALGGDDVALGTALYEQGATSVAAGQVGTVVGQAVCAWIEAHLPVAA